MSNIEPLAKNLLAFCVRRSDGQGGEEVVRVSDCICWRFLAGYPCQTAQQAAAGAGIQVVVIPIVPSGGRRHKKQCVHGEEEPPAHASTAIEGLLEACRAAAAALLQAGVQAVVDDNTRSTPGKCTVGGWGVWRSSPAMMCSTCW